jgi:hypothetical protein
LSRRIGFEAALMATVWVGGPLLAIGAHAHPSDLEIRAAAAERASCEAPLEGDARIDPARLGMSASELQTARPDVVHVREPAVAGAEPDDPAGSSPDPSRPARGLDRWVGEGTEDVARFEYELWRNRIYRIRWALSGAFERPVLDELVRRARICLGPPLYDQRFEAEPGSPRATLRRIGWRHGSLEIELRQLHPLRGGPVYLTVTRRGALREIAAAGVVRPPDPERTAPWWQRSMAAPRPASPAERKDLGDRFARLLSQLDH